METNSLCVEVYKESTIPSPGFFSPPICPTGPGQVSEFEWGGLLTTVLRSSQRLFSRADTWELDHCCISLLAWFLGSGQIERLSRLLLYSWEGLRKWKTCIYCCWSCKHLLVLVQWRVGVSLEPVFSWELVLWLLKRKKWFEIKQWLFICLFCCFLLFVLVSSKYIAYIENIAHTNLSVWPQLFICCTQCTKPLIQIR